MRASPLLDCICYLRSCPLLRALQPLHLQHLSKPSHLLLRIVTCGGRALGEPEKRAHANAGRHARVVGARLAEALERACVTSCARAGELCIASRASADEVSNGTVAVASKRWASAAAAAGDEAVARTSRAGGRSSEPCSNGSLSKLRRRPTSVGERGEAAASGGGGGDCGEPSPTGTTPPTTTGSGFGTGSGCALGCTRRLRGTQLASLGITLGCTRRLSAGGTGSSAAPLRGAGPRGAPRPSTG